MLFWSSIAVCLLFFLGLLLLLWLCAIDLKLRILPDELNIALGITGMLFHMLAAPYAGPWYAGLLGGLIGGGGLLLVRNIANRIYGFETMGLGDIKLLAAGGLWLGIDGIVMALCVGAFAGVFHGVGALLYKRHIKHQTVSFREMTIPAGPGFCVGLAVIAVYIFHGLPLFAGAQ